MPLLLPFPLALMVEVNPAPVTVTLPSRQIVLKEELKPLPAAVSVPPLSVMLPKLVLLVVGVACTSPP